LKVSNEGPQRSALGYALVAAAAGSWGTWPLVLRAAHARGAIAQELVSFVVMAAITIVPLPLLWKDRVRERAPWQAWAGLVWLGIADAANIALFFGAYAKTSVAIAVLTHSLAPLFVAVVSPFLLGETPRRATFGAVLLALTGLVLLLAPWRATHGAGDFAGAMLGAGSAVFYASNVIVSKKLAGRFSATELMSFHGLVALPLLALLVPHDAWSAASTGALGIVALAGVGPGALSGLLFTWGLRRVPASHASTLTLLEPVGAVLLSVLVLGERVPPLGWLGVLLVLGSAGIVLSGGRGEAKARAFERV
jgi:drug/metabolite transporter (DMT)-like permease